MSTRYACRKARAKRASPRFATRRRQKFPQAGWSIRTRNNAAPALSSNIERFSQFLTLVGLTALVVGGVGVANAVSAYLDGKRGVIATFKSLGASGGFVFTALSVADPDHRDRSASCVGLVLAALMPFAASAALASFIPVPTEGGIYPGALALAAAFGVLVTLAFRHPAARPGARRAGHGAVSRDGRRRATAGRAGAISLSRSASPHCSPHCRSGSRPTAAWR